MSGIQSSIGIITGVPIADTVDQLIAISSRPRDLLVGRTAQLKQQQVAITELTASVIGVQLQSDKLGANEVFDAVKVSSSNSAVVSTRLTGTPTKGSFTFTPVRQAQSQQLISRSFASDTESIGETDISFRFGGFIDKGLQLTELNGGSGIERGQIRITDRSGATDIIDLRYAQNVDDVIDAINSSVELGITAVTSGDRIKLVDVTGSTDSNLKVQEVTNGTTAASLGLQGIDVAADEATGDDIFSLSAETSLESLNNGNGISYSSSLPDLVVDFRDGSSALEIDFENETTLGDIIQTINDADPARLVAKISDDGNRIELQDLTADTGGTFAVSNYLDGTTAEDLGLTEEASGDAIASRRLRAGLKTALLSSLSGGNGFGDLGEIELADRTGATATVDLSSAETLDDVIDLINASTVQVTAKVNDSRNGIVLTDTSGGTLNLVVANGSDGKATADTLGITFDDSANAVDSGSLNLQTVSRSTSLEDLNEGQGVDLASFVITDSSGSIGAVNIAASDLNTVGDVIDAINALSIGVTATINDRGDAIQLTDSAGGTGTLSIAESGNGTAAADLGLLGTATTVDLQGSPTQIIDGSKQISVSVTDAESLDDLILKINELNVDISASKFFDGNSYRLMINSLRSGKEGELQIDTGALDLGLKEINKAQDALIQVGSTSSPGSNILASSSTNTFSEVIGGVEFTLNGTSDDSVTISVGTDDSKIISSLQLFVDQYNLVFDKLAELTEFQSNESETDLQISTGILFGTSEALRVEQSLSNLITTRFANAGSIKTLAEVGIDINETGKLSLNQEKFRELYSTNPLAVKEFFTTETTGVSDRFQQVIDDLAGVGNSVLVGKSSTLQTKIDFNNTRIENLNELLEKERIRLLTQFYTLESTIQNLQSNQSAISQIQKLPALVLNKNS